ncbi:MAG TPA: ribosome silencing factor [Synechococcales cyanobacterium M55_K2018_004]|nr:ribosome silencing factor [Synechococcales cyanobacterium M55_K2018_004]
MTNYSHTPTSTPASVQATEPPASGVVGHATPLNSTDLAIAIAQAADERKGGNIVILKVADVSYLTDYFVLVTGFSNVQVRAIARHIEDTLEQTYNRLPLRTEGQEDANWVLIDYGDVIVHIFLPREREFYNLEAFWGHAEQVPFTAESVSHRAT